MEQEFNPDSYREDLLDRIKERKEQYDQKLEDAKKSGEKLDLLHIQSERYNKIREPLMLARWSEEYWRAKLLKHKNYVIGENGEIIEKQSGYSTQELANIAKLYDYFECSIKDVMDLLAKNKIPESVIKSDRTRDCAKSLFLQENTYGDGVKIDNANMINQFVRIFGLENNLKEFIFKKLDQCVRLPNRNYALDLIRAYPVADISEVKDRFDAQYYPLPEGLKGKTQTEEFFGDILDKFDSEVPFKIIAPILGEKAELLATDLKNDPNLYWELKRSFMLRHDRIKHNYGYGRRDVLRDDSFASNNKDRYYCRVLYFLGEDPSQAKDMVDIHEARKSVRLEFHFSCNKKDIHREIEQQSDDIFTTTNIFRFEGLYIGNQKFNSYREPGISSGELIRINKNENAPKFPENFKCQKAALTELVKELLSPEKDFSENISELKKLMEKYGLPEAELADLRKSIKEFSTYIDITFHNQTKMSS